MPRPRPSPRSPRRRKAEETRHDDPLPATPLLPEGLRRRRRRPRPRVLLSARRQRREGGRRHRGQRLGGDPHGRPRGGPHRPLRDGAGHLHGARPARGRGARLRLGERHGRVRLAQRARAAQPRLGLDVHGRQPGRARLARLRAQGRRRGARDARGRRRRAVEGAGRGVRRGQGRHHPRPLEAPAALRPGGRAGGDAPGPAGREASRPEGLEDRRQADAAPGHPRQGAGQARLRHRRHAARDAPRLHRAVPRVRRQGEVAGRLRGPRDARGEEGRARGGLRGRRRGQLVARRPGPQEGQGGVGSRRVRHRPRTRPSRPCSARASRTRR